MSKDVFDKVLEHIDDSMNDLYDLNHNLVERAIKLGKLYKEFFNTLSFNLYGDEDSLYLSSYLDDESSITDSEAIKLFMKIEVLENE